MAQVLLHQTGSVPYQQCLQMQHELFGQMVEQRAQNAAEGEKAGVLILCSHPHVYTIGKSGRQSNLLVDGDFLESIGASLHRVDRGGDITYHGPGQTVAYPIFDLGVIGLGLREYIFRMEQAVMDTVALWGINAMRVEGATGVWVEGGGQPLRKICAIGVRSSHSVTMHGLALNVNTDLRYFSYINPCGFTDRSVTSMEAECGEPVDEQSVRTELCRSFEKNMNIKIIK